MFIDRDARPLRRRSEERNGSWRPAQLEFRSSERRWVFCSAEIYKRNMKGVPLSDKFRVARQRN